MPEWIRVTIEILNLGLSLICVILLLMIWAEISPYWKSSHGITTEGGEREIKFYEGR